MAFLYHTIFLYWWIHLCIVCILVDLSLGKCLLREPPDIDAPPQQTDAGFFLEISGNPQYYEPGNLYTVTLTVRIYFNSQNTIFPLFYK